MENTQEITSNTPEVTGTLYASLKAECEAAGLRLGTVCRAAGVDRSIVQKWKKEDPKTIRVANAIREAIYKLKNQTNE